MSGWTWRWRRACGAEKEHDAESRSGWRTRGIQKERKKERRKVITRRDGQLPRTRSPPNRFSEKKYVAGSRCMRIFKIVCYILLPTIRFAPSSTPASFVLLPPFALGPIQPPATLSSTDSRCIRERSPEVFIYMDRGLVRAYLLSSVAVMARPPPPYLLR